MFPQSTMLDPLFWMLLGALQVLVFAGANEWAKMYRLGMNWWKWALVGGWWFTLTLTVAGAFTLLGENEGNAGWYFLGFVGAFVIVAGAIIMKVLMMTRPGEQQA